MAIPINIGLPPKGTMSKPNWLERKQVYTKLEITPYIIETKTLEEAVEDLANNTISFDSTKGSLSLAARATALGLPKGTYSDFKTINIYALQEGAVNETYTNDISSSTLIGNIYENFSNNKLADFMRVINSNFGEGATGNMLSDMVSTIGNYLDPEIASRANEAVKGIDFQNASGSIKDYLDKNKIFGKNTNEILAAFGGAAADTLSGHRPIYPKLWNNSSTSTAYSFRVRLYNPNPMSTTLHKLCITNPLCILKALVMPSTIGEQVDEETKEVTFESVTEATYFPPLYMSVKVADLFYVPAAMIETMSVTLGGDENSLAMSVKYGRPNYVDVSMTFKPLYQVKVISDKTVSNYSNEFLNMKELIGETADAENQEEDDETQAETSSEVTTATGGNANQSDQAADRVDETSKEVYEQAKPIETETVPSFITMPGQ